MGLTTIGKLSELFIGIISKNNRDTTH